MRVPPFFQTAVFIATYIGGIAAVGIALRLILNGVGPHPAVAQAGGLPGVGATRARRHRSPDSRAAVGAIAATPNAPARSRLPPRRVRSGLRVWQTRAAGGGQVRSDRSRRGDILRPRIPPGNASRGDGGPGAATRSCRPVATARSLWRRVL